MYQQPLKHLGIVLIRLNTTKGVVRCFHTETDKTINLLQSFPKDIHIEIQTIGISGTIKALKKKYEEEF